MCLFDSLSVLLEVNDDDDDEVEKQPMMVSPAEAGPVPD